MKLKIASLMAACVAFAISSSIAQSWSLTGDAGTTPAVNFIGTTDFTDFKIKTDNKLRMVVRKNGNVGIGTGAPKSKLDVAGTITGKKIRTQTIWDTGTRIGIGTQIPSADLHITPNSSTFAFRIDQGTNGNGMLTYVNTTSSSRTVFSASSNTTGLYVKGNGFVGVGTSSPTARLDVLASSGLVMNIASSFSGSLGQVVNIERSNAPSVGNDILQISVPGGSPDNFQFIEADRGGGITFALNGDGGAGFGGSASTGIGVHSRLGGDAGLSSGGYIISGSTTGTNIVIDDNEIMARDNGATAPLHLQHSGGNIIMCNPSGQVSIGIITPATGYLLSVDGKAMFEEVRVELSGSWPDYVFQDNYAMRSLDELRHFIDVNGHLPGMPSAAKVATEGHHIGEVQKALVEKTEEHTLYILQLKQEIEELKAQLAAFRQ